MNIEISKERKFYLKGCEKKSFRRKFMNISGIIQHGPGGANTSQDSLNQSG